MKLNKICKNDLIHSGLIDDCTNTHLALNDYDWMNYVLTTRFVTEQYGVLDVEFEYYGSTNSKMKVIRINNKEKETYEYTYDTNIFKKHIVTFLMKHIDSWNSKFAFDGEDNVLEFYNEVISVGKLHQ